MTRPPLRGGQVDVVHPPDKHALVRNDSLPVYLGFCVSSDPSLAQRGTLSASTPLGTKNTHPLGQGVETTQSRHLPARICWRLISRLPHA
jgi:hypothetical protein